MGGGHAPWLDDGSQVPDSLFEAPGEDLQECARQAWPGSTCRGLVPEHAGRRDMAEPYALALTPGIWYPMTKNERVCQVRLVSWQT